MFSVRTIASRSLQTKTGQKIIQSSFSTTTPKFSSSLSEEEGIVEKGKVKSYNNKKAYGFIISDVDSAEIFVHRTGIVGAPSNDIFNPTLMQNESVQYKRVTREGSDGKFVAKEVVFANGDKVPLYRGKVRTYNVQETKINSYLHPSNSCPLKDLKTHFEILKEYLNSGLIAVFI